MYIKKIEIKSGPLLLKRAHDLETYFLKEGGKQGQYMQFPLESKITVR